MTPVKSLMTPLEEPAVKKRTRLVCDDCGMEITDPRHGELAWAWRDEAKERVWVVHAPYACPRWKHQTLHLPRHVQERGTANLAYFMGRSGLLELLARIETGDMPVQTGLELVRRLHVGRYEQYRLDRRKLIADEAECELPAKPDRQAFCEYLDLKKEAAADPQD